MDVVVGLTVVGLTVVGLTVVGLTVVGLTVVVLHGPESIQEPSHSTRSAHEKSLMIDWAITTEELQGTVCRSSDIERPNPRAILDTALIDGFRRPASIPAM